MRNRKILFGTIILLFAITGICSIPNVSAAETIEIPPLTYYYYYMGYLEYRDKILINEIDPDGAINVYIMNGYQFEALQDSGGLIWNYLKRWQDTTYLYGWSFDITEDGDYYVVLYNKNILFGRTVYVDIGVRYYSPVASDNFFLGWLLFIILPVIAGVVIVAILVSRRKKKIPREVIVTQEKIIPIKVYCSKCGIEILDKSRKFCSNCGIKIIN